MGARDRLRRALPGAGARELHSPLGLHGHHALEPADCAGARAGADPRSPCGAGAIARHADIRGLGA